MSDQRSAIPSSPQEFLRKYGEGASIALEGARADTGRTPKETIWTKNKAKLYHYQTGAEKKYRTPVMIVYALINRPYVLDLIPGNSLVEYLSNEGFDMYMIDWGTPGDEDAEMTFEDYVLDYIPRAARKVMRTAGTEDFTLFGYCMGGTMSAMYAALFPETLKNLLLLTAPIDFSKEHLGLYALFTDEKYLDADLLADAFGNIPGEMIDTGNRMMKPITNYVGTYVSMWERIFEDKSMETWLAMNKWVNDGPPFPGQAFRQWIHEFYQQNRLVKGEISLRGRRVDLSRIDVPLLSIAGKKDHICTVPQAEAIMDLVSSRDKEFYVLDAGHVGLLTGRNAKKTLWPKVRGWLADHSDPA
ncbi:class III poly(R)-hydroxyalkanoic acid synthase subunit PhaC [Rubrobacter naiadicus]|uniref:class III poly(R)-hydroxyalkanoic acid synthase subunit PhaC n=1 Tax=Rubrobacter naiadicus TaxID=1392641 RepID=UPI002360009D|nr:class III poly(R)-hydroxyalkanoic acid synthase subunit PhaC [Rubrobacter naiadicus]